MANNALPLFPNSVAGISRYSSPGFLCETEEELQKQFILVNNTRPLPKALVYELLPKVGDLPPRMSNRSPGGAGDGSPQLPKRIFA